VRVKIKVISCEIDLRLPPSTSRAGRDWELLIYLDERLASYRGRNLIEPKDRRLPTISALNYSVYAGASICA
jgi:hypothetical protein